MFAIELRECRSPTAGTTIGGFAMFSHGAVTSIVGLNGCGKSTMVKLVDGLLQPQAGRCASAGCPRCRSRRGARPPVAVGRPAALPAMTVEALVACGRNPYQAHQGKLARGSRA
ncbi:MAG: ATP-binding cassette domain-containing protein [Eggerthella lenta]